MTLSALIQKGGLQHVATATPATVATHEGQQGRTIAIVATVAVASPQNAKAEGVDLTALLTEACQDVPGIDAATFVTLLSPEDVKDIEGGHIPVHALRAYAKSFAEGIRCGRITVLAAAIPKPAGVSERVRGADCRHFLRDTIGDGTGIGGCKVRGEGTAQNTTGVVAGRKPTGSPAQPILPDLLLRRASKRGRNAGHTLLPERSRS